MDNLMELILEQEKSDVIDNLMDVYQRFIDLAKDNGIVSYKDKDDKEVTIEEEERKLSELANPDDLISALNDFVGGLDKDDNLKDSAKKYDDAKKSYDEILTKTKKDLNNIEETIRMIKGSIWMRLYVNDNPMYYEEQLPHIIEIYTTKYGLDKNGEGLDCLNDFVKQLIDPKIEDVLEPKDRKEALETLTKFIKAYNETHEVKKESEYDFNENIRANINLSYEELKTKIDEHKRAIEGCKRTIDNIKKNADKSGLSDEQLRNIEIEQKQIDENNKYINIYYGIYLLKKLREDNLLTEQDFKAKIEQFEKLPEDEKAKEIDRLEEYKKLKSYIYDTDVDLSKELEDANKSLIDTANNDELKQAKKELDEAEKDKIGKEFADLNTEKEQNIKNYQDNKDCRNAFEFLFKVLLGNSDVNKENITEKIDDYITKIKNSESDPKALEEIEKEIIKYDPSKRDVNIDKLRKLTEHENLEDIKVDLEQEVLKYKTNSKVTPKGINKKAVLKAVAGIAGGVVGFGLAVNPVTGAILTPLVTTVSMGKTAWNVVKFVDQKLHKGIDEKDLATTKFINKISAPLKKLGSKIEKHLPKGLKDGLDKVNKALKNEYVQATFNGMAAGYSIGKIYKVGKNIFEARSATTEAKGQTFKSPTTQEDYNLNRNTTLEPRSSVGDLAQVPRDTGILDFVKGQTYDLSEIAKGYAASGQASDKAVNLITAAGKNVTFDRTVIRDGVEWCHFLQENGQGYAWFPKEVVEEVLKAKGLH